MGTVCGWFCGWRDAPTAAGNARTPRPGIPTGIPFDQEAKDELFEQLGKTYISGITFSGGDPLHKNNITEITRLAKEIREKFPDKTIWLYTGSLWESIQKEEIVRYLDVCVDGEFIVEQMDTSLKWKGSANQRVIDVKKPLQREKSCCIPGTKGETR